MKKVKAGGGRNRLLLAGLGAAVLLPPLAARAAAERLRRRPDPDAGEMLDEPMGEKGCYLESFDGTRIFAEEIGRGPALVLVHGWFCNTDMWHFQKKFLSDRFRMICFDQRGHARSDCPDGKPLELEEMARDLAAVLDRMAPDDTVVLVGHSMGGMSVLRYCQMFPGELGRRVRGVALLDTSHLPMSRTMVGGAAVGRVQSSLVEPAFRFAARHAGLSDRVKDLVIGTAPFLVATRYLGYGSGASLTQMEYISRMAAKTSMKGACLAGLGLFSVDRPASLESLRASGIPVLVWVGEKDKLTRPRVSEQMCRELPAAELHIEPDTGHPSYMEVYDRFNDTLSAFAERCFRGEGEG